MIPKRVLNVVNVALTVGVVAVLLGCGGDPMDPPKGSLEEKLCGEWVSDPIPTKGDQEPGGVTAITVEFSYWNTGLSASYPEVETLRSRPTATSTGSRYSGYGFTISGATATSRSGDDSTWEFRLDPDDEHTLYAIWTRKDGTKLLDGVKFRKKQ